MSLKKPNVGGLKRFLRYVIKKDRTSRMISLMKNSYCDDETFQTNLTLPKRITLQHLVPNLRLLGLEKNHLQYPMHQKRPTGSLQNNLPPPKVFVICKPTKNGLSLIIYP